MIIPREKSQNRPKNKIINPSNTVVAPNGRANFRMLLKLFSGVVDISDTLNSCTRATQAHVVIGMEAQRKK